MEITYLQFALSLIAVALVFGGLGVIAGFSFLQSEMDALRGEVEKLTDQLAD